MMSNQSEGYLFLHQDLGKWILSMAAFVGGGAGWAGSASYYRLAIAVGFVAGLLFALAFCVESKFSLRSKNLTLVATFMVGSALAFKFEHLASQMENDKRLRALPPNDITAPPGVGDQTNTTVNQTSGDGAPLVIGSPGAVVNYGSSPVPEQKPKK